MCVITITAWFLACLLSSAYQTKIYGLCAWPWRFWWREKKTEVSHSFNTHNEDFTYGIEWTSACWGDVSPGDSSFCCQRMQVSPVHSKIGASAPITWRSFLLNFFFLLDPFTPPFSSTAWRYSSYIPIVECFCLPSSQLPPVSPMLTSILALCQELSAYLLLLFSRVCVGI